jgi:hypothetical protein
MVAFKSLIFLIATIFASPIPSETSAEEAAGYGNNHFGNFGDFRYGAGHHNFDYGHEFDDYHHDGYDNHHDDHHGDWDHHDDYDHHNDHY